MHVEELFLCAGFRMFQLNALTANTAVNPDGISFATQKAFISGTSKGPFRYFGGTFGSHIGGNSLSRGPRHPPA